MFDTLLGTLLVLGYLLTWGLLPWVLLKKTVHPTAVVAWMLSIIFLPYLGAALCLIFGLNRVERHKAGRRAARRQITERSPIAVRKSEQIFDGLPTSHQQLVHLLEGLIDMPLTWGNHIEVLPDKKIAFDRMEAIIREAEQSLHVEFYIWRPDDTGHRLRDLLIERAQAGVEVRFIYDGVGSIQLGKKFLRPMREAGIHVAPFLPGRSFRERWSINLRNHRKLILADGRRAMTGGLNVGDEYLGKAHFFGNLRDTQLDIRGPAVLQLQQMFIEDWYFSSGEDLTDDRYFPQPQTDGDTVAHVIADGPDSDPNVFEMLVFAAINEAQEHITLSNPYFIPPAALAMAIETAARRGVQVRMIVARDSTFPWTLMAGRSYYDPLLAAGVEIYEYQTGLYHPKTLTIDGNWSLVGTMNFDNRSFALNFEVGLAMYGSNIASQLEAHFEHDLEFAEQIDPARWSQRSTWNRLSENFCRLFQPIL